MKRIVAILCAVMLLMACCISVSAEGDGKITINGTVVGQTYSIYKIADLSLSTDGKAYTYTAVDAWVGFFQEQSTFFSIAADTNIVTLVGSVADDSTEAAAIAAAAIAYAETKDIGASESKVADADSVVFEGLELGYYLVDSTVGTLCILNTTDKEFSKNEKNVAPTVEKEVKEGENWGDTNDGDFFDTVEFKTTFEVMPGAQGYVLVDSMVSGLKYNNNSVSVTVDGAKIEAPNATVASQTDAGFSVEFADAYISTIVGKTVVVEYTATITADATIGGAGNENKTYLNYGKDSALKSNEDTTTTYVFSFDLVKTDTDKKVLDGAKFKLYDAATAGNEIPVVELADGSYRVAKTGETGVEIETLNGKATIAGLDSATYYLEETLAPTGYNKLTARQSVTIDAANNDATVTDGIYIQGGVQVINKTGAVLPETGGFGTTIFILVGGLVALLAGIFFVTRVRMSKVVD